MSVELATFRPMPGDECAEPMHVTAFHGGDQHGPSVQLTIGEGLRCQYVTLSKKQTIRLAAMLMSRVFGITDENKQPEEVLP